MRGQRPADVDDHPPGSGNGADAEQVDLASIVVMSDATPWRQRVAVCLADNGFVVHFDPTGDAAFDHRARAAGAAIVDLGLAARPASAVLAAWRHVSDAPIVAVANSRDEATVLAAYAAGADHVAPMDVSARQLLARLRSVLRRGAPSGRQRGAESGSEGPVVLDAEAGVAIVGGTKIALTRQEYDFLQLLIERDGRLVARSEIKATAGATGSSERAIDFFVRRLREKLERVDGQRRIVVVRGVGFRFEAETGASVAVPT